MSGQASQDLAWLDVAVRNYCTFLDARGFHKQVIAPTADVAWVWHLHLLHPKLYAEFCIERYGQLLNPIPSELINCQLPVYSNPLPTKTRTITSFNIPLPLVNEAPATWELLHEKQMNFLRDMFDFTPGLPRKRLMIHRYISFMRLLQDPQLLLVPTKEIDLVWHSNMHHPEHYKTLCLMTTGYLVDHNDLVDDQELAPLFEASQQIYAKEFNQERGANGASCLPGGCVLGGCVSKANKRASCLLGGCVPGGCVSKANKKASCLPGGCVLGGCVSKANKKASCLPGGCVPGGCVSKANKKASCLPGGCVLGGCVSKANKKASCLPGGCVPGGCVSKANKKASCLPGGCVSKANKRASCLPGGCVPGGCVSKANKKASCLPGGCVSKANETTSCGCFPRMTSVEKAGIKVRKIVLKATKSVEKAGNKVLAIIS